MEPFIYRAIEIGSEHKNENFVYGYYYSLGKSHYIVCNAGSKNGLIVEIDASTLGVYTFIHDNNDTKIFTGDLVRVLGDKHAGYEVIFDGLSFMLKDFYSPLCDSPTDALGEYPRDYFTVVGNIYTK